MIAQRTVVPFLLGMIGFAGSCCALATSPSRIMQCSVREALGQDYDKYHYVSYPTTRFAVGSIFRDAIDDSLCDPAECYGFDRNDAAAWMNINGLAVPHGNGGPITLTQKKEQKLLAEAILPQIYQMVSVEAKAARDSTTSVNLQITQAIPRDLLKFKVMPLLAGNPSGPLKELYYQRRLVVVTNDLVATGMTIHLCTSSQTEGSLGAKLGQALGKVIGSDASLTLSVKASGNSCYDLAITKPVVIAYIARRQPAAGTLASRDDFDDWTRVPASK